MSEYKKLSPEQLEHHLQNYLISSLSYSKITGFARNEKAFEMNHIFGVRSKSSATTVAGQAYHRALDYYFTSKKGGKQLDLPELEQSAWQFLDDVPANAWKIQKTANTVEACQQKATKVTGDLLRNFISEVLAYEEDMAEILDVEVYCDEWLTINGVEIPLPFHMRIDLVIRTKDGKIVIIDHKSKNAFTDEEELAMAIGVQAIIYVKGYEARTGLTVDEVWFIENKYSQNKDKTVPQLMPFKLPIDDNTRRLYEALVYEPIKRTVQAVSDPDYVYLINDSDNLQDMAEIYDHWARTMICEVDDFNVEESKKQLITKRLRKIRDAGIASISPQVIKKFRDNAATFIPYDLSNKDMTQSEKIEHILRSFGVQIQVAYTFEGYSSNTALIQIGAGVKVSTIQARKKDLANVLDVESVRVSDDLVVYQDRSYLAVEYKKKRDKDLNYDPSLLQGRKIPLGMDNFGNTVVWDWDNQTTPHAMVGGGTGSGKSVFLKSTIEYGLQTKPTGMYIFDPKYEFLAFNGRATVVNDILEIEEQMAMLVDHMNDLIKAGKKEETIVFFDEFADALDNARKGEDLKIYSNVPDGEKKDGTKKFKKQCTGELKSLAENLKMLAQKGRSCGFRILIATQRASTKVISGDTKVNFPVQICFLVRSETDSRVMLDESGAESLAGRGDGLIKSPELKTTTRFQAFFKD